MMFFSSDKPRRFSLRPIYTDERKERLRAIEERARRELAKPAAHADDGPDAEASCHSNLRGAFSRPHARRNESWSVPRLWILLSAAILAVLTFLFGSTVAGREVLMFFMR